MAELNTHDVCDDIVQRLFAATCMLQAMTVSAEDETMQRRLTTAIDGVGECIDSLRGLVRATA